MRMCEEVAGYLGAAAPDIGFTDCASTSMNLLAMMAAQKWKKGGVPRDQVALPRDEFQQHRDSSEP